MRTCIVLIMMLCAVEAVAQQPATFQKLKELPKGSNEIIITTTDSIDLAFKKISMLVMDYGLTIANSDKDLYFINTDAVPLNNYMFSTKASVRLKVIASGTSIILKGTGKNGVYEFQSENYHRKDVPNTVFAQLYEIATGYEGGTITTQKK